MANNYQVNYDDQRFKDVEADKKAAINEVDKTYGDMIDKSQSYFDKQIQASKDWADKQTQLQNEKTDLAIDKIEQQKEQAQKDYTREQSGAYVDWQKQSDQYGANAEQMASQGLQNSGFSESSQVSMWNTYQIRVATARESFILAKQNYDNAIREAQLQNSSLLAEIAYEALQKQLELSLQGFQYKNNLILEQANKKTELENTYYARYQDVLQQINHEHALAEEVRQYNERMAEEKRQYNATLALQQAQLAEEKRQFNETMAYNKAKSSGGGGGGGSSRSGGSGGGGAKVTKSSGSKKATVSKSSSSGSSKQAQIDMDSVIALGFGPISASRLNQLEEQGIVESYVSGGKIKFRKTPSTMKQQQLFGLRM